MNRAELVATVMARADIRGLKRQVIDGDGKLILIDYPVDDLRSAIESQADSALAFCTTIAGNQGFDFATKRSTVLKTADGSTSLMATVAGTNSYQMPGENQDARRIISVLYGTSEVKLTYVDAIESENEFSAPSSDSAVEKWTYLEPYGTIPVVKLFGTPTDAQRLTYRYARQDVTFDMWPMSWIHVVEDRIVSRMIPQYKEIADASVQSFTATYEGPKASPSHSGMHPDIRRRFNRINGMHGY